MNLTSSTSQRIKEKGVNAWAYIDSFSAFHPCFFLWHSCILHKGHFYLALVLTPITLSTVCAMFFLLRGNLSISCKNVAIQKRRQYWHLKSTTTILCLLYMAVTWSLCLAFLVLEKISVVIAFAVLNFFQGPLVIPFLSFVGIQLQRKIDSQTKIALRDSAIAALNQQPIKVCLQLFATESMYLSL